MVGAAILEALCAGGAYGQELIERVRAKTRGKLRPSQGATYTALEQMEHAGLVELYAVAQTTRGRPRRYVKLTKKGRRAARENRAMVCAVFGLRPKD
jgi:PadR family transcriptional regulator PadR